MLTKKKFGLIVMMLFVSFALIGCQDSENGNGEENGYENGNGTVETPPAGEHSQGVTDSRIYIANSAATSGLLAGVGVPFRAGIEAYLLMVNEGGGIHGREIYYLHRDDEFDPINAIAYLEGFIHDDEVFAIVGHFGTPVIAGTFDILLAERIPTVYFAAGIGVVYNENATDGNGRNTFPVQPVFPMEGRIFTAWAAGTFEAETIGVIFTGDDAGLDFIGGIEQEAATIGGLEIVSAQVEPNAVDVTAQVATVLAADPDVVIIGSIQGTLPQIARELANQGNTAPTLTSYVNADISIAAQIADDIEGHFDLFASSWVNIDLVTDDYRYWIARVSDEDFSLNSFAMTGWIAAHFFMEGLRRTPADNITWENFIEAMEEAPIQNPFGSVIDFANGSRVGTQNLALVQMDGSAEQGWVPFLDFMGMDEILGQ